jgi:NitT/TauT family transport system ATP-binding protein
MLERFPNNDNVARGGPKRLVSDGPAGPAKLSISRATKVYQTKSGPLPALEDVSFEVRDGEFVCVVGPSGCGKTTLLWAISGLHPLTRGEITVDGEPARAGHPAIAMIFQEANLLPWRTLLKNIHLPHELRRRREDRARVDALLERVGLQGFEHKYPRELSGGMQQRASIVRALSVDPSVLLMDEPFGALDAFTRDAMNMLIQEIWLETQKTVVFVTHSIPEAALLADRIVVLTPRPGRISRVVEVGFERPRSVDLTLRPEFVSVVAEIKALIQGVGEEREPEGDEGRVGQRAS